MLASPKLNQVLVKCLIETLIFLEFTDEKLLHLDSAVEMQELIASHLNALDKEDKALLKNLIKDIGNEHEVENIKRFILSLSESLGI